MIGPGEATPDRRNQITALISESDPPLSIATIAEEPGIHPSTVRFHLAALVESGRIERVPTAPTGRGRPAWAFRCPSRMNVDGPRNDRLLAEILTGTLAAEPDAGPKATAAGRTWGAFLVGRPAPNIALSEDQAPGRLTALLDDLGFSPVEQSLDGGRQIGLRHCPFFDLIETRGEVICPLHLGLMQGAMASLGQDTTIERLEPFATPDLCSPTSGRPEDEHSRRHRDRGRVQLARHGAGHLVPGGAAEVPRTRSRARGRARDRHPLPAPTSRSIVVGNRTGTTPTACSGSARTRVALFLSTVFPRVLPCLCSA